jgi:hypothetical protein
LTAAVNSKERINFIVLLNKGKVVGLWFGGFASL